MSLKVVRAQPERDEPHTCQESPGLHTLHSGDVADPGDRARPGHVGKDACRESSECAFKGVKTSHI